MAKPSTPQAAIAESILKSRLRAMKDDVQYTGKYETGRGRRLMLKRQVQFIGLFAECFPGEGAIAGVSLNRHHSTPGHYAPGDPRASSIASDPRLGLGQEAFYVRCDTPTALEQFVDWYELQ